MFAALDATLNWKVSAELVSITVFLEAMKNTTAYRLAGNNKEKKTRDKVSRKCPNDCRINGNFWMQPAGCNLPRQPTCWEQGASAQQRNWLKLNLNYFATKSFSGLKTCSQQSDRFSTVVSTSVARNSFVTMKLLQFILWKYNIIVKAIDRFPILISIWVSKIIRRKAVYRAEGGGQRRIEETEWYRKAEYYTQ